MAGDRVEARWDDMALVGLITRPHGLRGHVVVRAETDFVERRFGPGSVVFFAVPGDPAAPKRLVVKEARWQAARLVVLFEGCASIEDAETLGRGELKVDAADLEPLEPGRFYHHDLVGCDVVTVAGEAVGRVTRVEEFATATLTVRGRGHEVLIPLAAEICVEIDVAARRIVVAPPAGLLDVNS